MRAPLCFLCTLPVEGASPPIYVNGKRLHAHQECMAKRRPSAHLNEREPMRRKRGGPRPIGPQHVEERDGQNFIVTRLPEVKPDPRRTQKTILHLPPGDTGSRQRKKSKKRRENEWKSTPHHKYPQPPKGSA